MTTDTYGLSIRLEDDGFKVLPHEKEGDDQLYRDALKAFSITLDYYISQEGNNLWCLIGDALVRIIDPSYITDNHLQDLVKKAIFEAMVSFIKDAYCRSVPRKRQGESIIKLRGEVTSLSPLICNLEAKVIDHRYNTDWIAITTMRCASEYYIREGFLQDYKRLPLR